MIIIQVAGGLGNQLQQYALYQKYLKLGIEARLDVSWFLEHSLQRQKLSNQGDAVTQRTLELDYFDGLSYEVCTPKEREAMLGGRGLPGKIRRKLFPWTVHHFSESRPYHPEIFGFDHMYLSGYFACEKYYVDILRELRENIQFPESRNPLNRQIADEMKSCSSVSVHIRRGDYLNPENQKLFGNICTESYYQAAMQLLRRKVPDAKFYLFSDDVEYLKEKFTGEEYTIVDVNRGADSLYDMWLMSHCKHNICANSTFSFWGARLNGNKDKIMVRPTIHKNTQTFQKEEMEELWQGWYFVSPEGQEC